MSPDYICAGISAMEDALDNAVLRGRLFGGVSILVCDVYIQLLSVFTEAVLSIGNVVFVNLYLPNYRSQADVLLLILTHSFEQTKMQHYSNIDLFLFRVFIQK